MVPSAKRIIGRRENVSFPDLGISAAVAKIDTGAYTSSLHVSQIRSVFIDDIEHVRFVLEEDEFLKVNQTNLMCPVYRRTVIRNSFGQRELRFAIKTKIKIARRIFTTELTLADRSTMAYPVLLGRKLLRRGFLVDVTQVQVFPQ